MSTASFITFTLAGWAAALFLWFATPLALHEMAPAPLPGQGNLFASAEFSYLPGQSGVIRIVPSANITYTENPGWIVIKPTACIDHIAINGAIISWFPYCRGNVMTMDISPWLHRGKNEVEVAFHATGTNGAVLLRSMHSTPVMLTILYFLYFGLTLQWALRADWKTLWKRVNPARVTLLVIGIAAACYARSGLMDIVSNDYRAYISHWFEAIRLFPGIPYTASGSNYTPFYVYMMALFDRFFPMMNMLYAVKWLSFLGDAFAGFWLWRIMALCSRHPLLPPAAVTLLWLAPSVILNSAAMSQCDIWWVGMLLAAIYYLCRQRPSPALFWGGLAFAFKMQAVFLAPLLLILLIEAILPWKRLWILPAAYLLTCLPAWFEGVPLSQLLTVYWAQFHTYNNVTSTGNLYAWLPLSYSDALINTGVVFAIITAVGLIAWTHRHWPRRPTLIHCLLLAALFSTLMPFILPKMINRYFLAGDVFTLTFACLRPRWFLLPLLMQCASTLCFEDWQIGIAQQLTGLNNLDRFRIAALLYAAAIAIIVQVCRHHLWKNEPCSEKPH